MTADVLALLGGDPRRAALFEAAEGAILALGPTEMAVSNTQISWGNPLKFAFLSLPRRVSAAWPEGSVILTFGLGHRSNAPCIAQAVEPYPNRWTHHVVLANTKDVDDVVRDLLAQAYLFSIQKRR